MRFDVARGMQRQRKRSSVKWESALLTIRSPKSCRSVAVAVVEWTYLVVGLCCNCSTFSSTFEVRALALQQARERFRRVESRVFHPQKKCRRGDQHFGR